MTATTDPNIIAFCCKYCSYAAADLAGSMRLDYPASVKVVQVPCTGRVDVIHLLKGLDLGGDIRCLSEDFGEFFFEFCLVRVHAILPVI